MLQKLHRWDMGLEEMMSLSIDLQEHRCTLMLWAGVARWRAFGLGSRDVRSDIVIFDYALAPSLFINMNSIRNILTAASSSLVSLKVMM